jgi:hypothetical protein
MSDQKVTLEFNTAITELDPATGKWDEKEHNQSVIPLRGLIMQIDGVTGCHIARYGMEVNYLPRVISRSAVIEAVQAAVQECAKAADFFPMRGDKQPAALASEPQKSRTTCWWIAKVTFNTDLFINFDDDATKAVEDELLRELATGDGVRRPGIGQRTAWVLFDKRITQPADMREHLESFVAGLMRSRKEKELFPFTSPTFVYEEGETNYVING